jgi:predicted nucleic acid-binding Zn ribbon protein
VKIKRVRRKGLRPSTQPRPTSQLLDGTFRWLKLDENAASFRAMHAFHVAAGARIGEHARAERLRGSILYVRCDSSSWTQHLHMLKASILERLHKTPGGQGVNELRFNVGPLDEVAGWEPPTPATAPEPQAAPHALPDELAHALDDIDDPELRAHIAKLYGKLGTRPKK